MRTTEIRIDEPRNTANNCLRVVDADTERNEEGVVDGMENNMSHSFTLLKLFGDKTLEKEKSISFNRLNRFFFLLTNEASSLFFKTVKPICSIRTNK